MPAISTGAHQARFGSPCSSSTFFPPSSRISPAAAAPAPGMLPARTTHGRGRWNPSKSYFEIEPGFRKSGSRGKKNKIIKNKPLSRARSSPESPSDAHGGLWARLSLPEGRMLRLHPARSPSPAPSGLCPSWTEAEGLPPGVCPAVPLCPQRQRAPGPPGDGAVPEGKRRCCPCTARRWGCCAGTAREWRCCAEAAAGMLCRRGGGDAVPAQPGNGDAVPGRWWR